MLRKFITKRRTVQAVMGAMLIIAIMFFHISLLWILILGSVMGIIFGKVFCRWMCPMGFIMELMMGGKEDNKQQMYNYHKMGCPIAWISGFLNKFSLFKVKKDAKTCVDCGICDKQCYISSFNKDYSLFKNDFKNPSKHFSCSKCLACVEKCPTKSLKYKILVKD